MLLLKKSSLNWVKTMLKALLKKQLLEFFSGFTIKGKDGKRSGSGAKAGAVILMLFMGFSFFGMFFSVAYMMAPVLEGENQALYLSVFGILSVLTGLMGSVFLTYNALYAAKDNDMLLSMPVSPSLILFARMAGLYITTLGFEALVLIPAVIVFFAFSGFSATVFILFVINMLILPFLSLAVAMILGFVIALFASKIRNKSLITVAASLGFLGVYYFASLKLNSFITILVYQPEEVIAVIKKWFYPFYLFGEGLNGDIVSFLAFALVSLFAFVVIFFILSRTFFSLATVNRGMKKRKYKEKRGRRMSAKYAFCKKELLYFKNTPVYILNCSFGSVMVMAAAIVLALKKEAILPILLQNGFQSVSVPLIAGIALCLISSSNNITSVSVSLEGKNVYLLHSMPCKVTDVFFGKIMLHMIFSGIPLIIGNIIVAISLGTDILTAILFIIFSLLFTFVCAATGLIINILFPKMEWTNETSPVKQSMSSLLGVFSGFAYGLVLLFAEILTADLLSSWGFLISASVVFAVIAFLLSWWLKEKGSEKFIRL